MDTGACNTQFGCFIIQRQPEGDVLPIGYWNCSLSKHKRAGSTTERECLAVVWAIHHLRPYLEGIRFTLRTNHHTLCWILNLAFNSARAGGEGECVAAPARIEKSGAQQHLSGRERWMCSSVTAGKDVDCAVTRAQRSAEDVVGRWFCGGASM